MDMVKDVSENKAKIWIDSLNSILLFCSALSLMLGYNLHSLSEFSVYYVRASVGICLVI